MVVHQFGEVFLQEIHDCEGLEGGDERLTLFPHVPSAVDGLHHRGVGRGATNTKVFELLNQRRFGVPVRWLRVVTLGFGTLHRDQLPLFHGWQDTFLVGQLGLGVVTPFHVGPAKSREFNAQTGRRKSQCYRPLNSRHFGQGGGHLDLVLG